ncbi:phytoene desaturase family protein [Polymorphobacter fuscus]|uniref:Phytoene desaturase n=1 Tax=Sandarakinorhabdus fusca TaxID=1439888 RepID=A0A7C9GWY0_9SPHN|nr:phytoene desaturase family protein [Polymorphobacter fuscus]KAB7647568.1 phytoene desaturase [Polymorphobacter fuscus]MQT16834.1 phytoene desaturase [Polymorphobacter fuscus]NJC09177.1 phytoene desaturase [Polymorphobacter fuscus]
MQRKTAIVIGSGIGGIACAMRLQSLGFQTHLLEKLDAPGGRAYVRRAEGFTFDMGPTVLTVPHFIEELFSLEQDHAMLGEPDFPADVLGDDKRITSGISGGPNTSRYVEIIPILPFYRIYFDDGTFFDYDADPVRVREQIARLAPEDLEGYEAFHEQARQIFNRGFLELGYTYFGSVGQMLGVVPDLLKLGAVQPLFSLIKKYFKSDKMRRVFSFEPLLVGGNPMKVPAIYAMIHFVEKTWGIHFARGGTGALISAFVKKYEEMGGTIRLGADVTRINVEKRDGKRVATGVTLASGETIAADVVVSNADYATTYMKMIDKKHRPINRDALVKFRKQSMSLMVIYFGYRKQAGDPDLQHHNIIFGPRYEELLTDIFERKILGPDFSQYLHIPTLTEPGLAPEGHHAAYTLIPVPNKLADLDWSQIGEGFKDKVLTLLEARGYIPNLKERLVYHSYVTPDYFEQTLGSYVGNGFGVEPVLTQTAFFRPHNRSEDISNLYLVGQSTQPGGGTPSVMMSAKMTVREIARDFAIDPRIVNGVPVRLPAAA